MSTTYVNPPASCDLCGNIIISEFSDARIPRLGKWGNVCVACAIIESVAYGTGLGQRFVLNEEDGKFHKVESSITKETRDELVREALQNAAENDYTFEGWTDEAIAEDMQSCNSELEDEKLEDIVDSLRRLRSAD